MFWVYFNWFYYYLPSCGAWKSQLWVTLSSPNMQSLCPAQGSCRELVGWEADGAAPYNQFDHLHGHCCCLPASHEYPLILAHFVHLIMFLLVYFKPPALVLLIHREEHWGNFLKHPYARRESNSLLRRKTQAGYGNTGMLQMQTKWKCLLKSRGELPIWRALKAVARRIPCTGREATGTFWCLVTLNRHSLKLT